MGNKNLYIYGYGSNPRKSSTMKSLKGVIAEMGFDLESVGYSHFSPFESVNFLEIT
ncbi:hypothetical protein J5690_02245 [bacterium]|nr:hypothetical protein [bacterium]